MKTPKRKRTHVPRINVPLDDHHQTAVRAIMARMLLSPQEFPGKVSKERAIQHAVLACAEMGMSGG